MPRYWYSYAGLATATEFAKPSNYSLAFVPPDNCAGGSQGCQAYLYYVGSVPPSVPASVSSNIRSYFITATSGGLLFYPNASGRKPYVYTRA
jgi:hypothetical protein